MSAPVSGNAEPESDVPESDVPDSVCRHCGERVRRMPDLWLHVGEGDLWWHCRTTTTAGPTVDADKGIVPWHE